MALPRNAGRYIAVPTSWEVGEYNGAPVFEVLFKLRQFCDPQAGWQELQDDLSITKRFFLKKNDGSWSDHVITSIMESLGWDGASLKSLANGAWAEIEVQLTIDYEKSKKDGKEYIGVLFLNPRDYEGKQLASDPSIVQSLEAKYGGELKARKMGQQRPAAKPIPQKAAAPAAPNAAMNAAWREFKAKTPELSDAQRKAQWYETVRGYAGCDVKDVTPDGWQHVANSIAEHGVWKAQSPEPVGATLSNEDIPF
jgi:hypothetical protein